MFDIRDNALLAREWTAGHAREAFRENRQLFYAVTRCLEIVSEAGRKLPREVYDRHPELPWRAILDSGDFYRPRYDNVDEDILWDTVQRDLIPLLAVVESEIAALSSVAPAGRAATAAPGPDESVDSPRTGEGEPVNEPDFPS